MENEQSRRECALEWLLQNTYAAAVTIVDDSDDGRPSYICRAHGEWGSREEPSYYCVSGVGPTPAEAIVDCARNAGWLG